LTAFFFFDREILFSDKRPFDWDVTGKSIVLLYGLAPVYFSILLLLEYTGDGGSGGALGRVLRSAHATFDRMRLSRYGIQIDNGQLALSDQDTTIVPLDEDVVNESEYVKNTQNLESFAPVVIKDIWKAYPPSVGCSRNQKPRLAVRGLSAAIRKGETFGLLGSNVSRRPTNDNIIKNLSAQILYLTFLLSFFFHQGAGKSTTLGMLTSDVAPTYGEAFVAGKDITGSVPGGVTDARKHIGLCPQVDP
jgi:ABC-type multidrug transport system fused ATPase/permease subunit